MVPDWKKITSAARETGVSRHNRSPINDPLKPLNMIVISRSEGLQGALNLAPYDAETRQPLGQLCV